MDSGTPQSRIRSPFFGVGEESASMKSTFAIDAVIPHTQVLVGGGAAADTAELRLAAYGIVPDLGPWCNSPPFARLTLEASSQG